VAAFADRLVHRMRRLGHPLCVGLDPHLDRIPPLFRKGRMAPGDPETAAAVEAFGRAVIERVAGHAAALKPQCAFFEALGPAGVAALARLLEAARAAGLPVVLDAKRGDVGSTAAAYARAYLAPDAPLRADALTVSPYLGADTLLPFVEAAEAGEAGLFVLVKTSNPGSGDVQDLAVGARPLYLRVADLLAPLGKRLRGPETEWSGLGVVVGGTWPDPALAVRDALPRSLFLVPGYGAQGATARDALAGFVRGPDGRLEGGLVSSSRAVLFPEGGHTDDLRRWERAFDAAFDLASTDLAEAVVSA
jgi:orotidine-5'-phosphate decarboxylase